MKQVDRDLEIVKGEMAYIVVLKMQVANLKNASKLEDLWEWKRICLAENFLKDCIVFPMSNVGEDYYENEADAFNHIRADWKRNGQCLRNDVQVAVNLLHSNPDIDPDKKVENLLRDFMYYIEDNIVDIKWHITIK